MLLMAFVNSMVLAASFTMRTASCPIGDEQVRIYDVVSDNQLGGFDSDLATYSSGEQARNFLISTCVSNYISLFGEDMSRIIPDDLAQSMLTQTEALRKQFKDPDNPEVWERYWLAAENYTLMSESDYFIAKLYLSAIWSARDTIVGYHAGLNGPLVIDQLLEQASIELAKPLSEDQRKVLLFNLARVAHRGGYSQIRDDYIDAFSALPNLTVSDMDSAQAFKNITKKVEPLFQIKLQSIFTPSVLAELNSQERAHAHYLLGDIARRQGSPELALTHYRAVLNEEKAEEKISTLANYFINKK
ncbi:MAG: hypothetical protein VXZ96_00550 [Myxococcota bacterium]|nr:hypothetical protein [Myxococcota bacterium]